jgi:hypothetical protein
MVPYNTQNHPLYALFTFNHGRLMEGEIKSLADYIAIMYDEDIAELVDGFTSFNRGEIVYETGLYYIIKR